MTTVSAIAPGAPLLMRKSVLGYLSALNVALLCFAFPLTSLVPLFLNMDSYYFNLFLRAGYTGLSLYLIIGAFFHLETRRIAVGGWFLLIFWLIYGVRLVYDIHVEGIVFKGDMLKLYGFAFGNCLLGAYATLLTIRFAPLAFSRRLFSWVIGIACVGILVGVIYQYQSLNPAEIVARARFTIDDGTERGKDVLNPITISLTGELFTLVITYLFLFGRLTLVRAVWAVPLFIVGILVMLLGASRGPFLGTVIGISVIVGIRVLHTRKTPLNLLVLVGIFLFSFLGIGYWVSTQLEKSEIVVLNRLQKISESRGGGVEPRELQWASAIEQFQDHPIIGDRYLERAYNFYPHNVYLEAPMATGIVGSFWFFGMIFIALGRFVADVYHRSGTVFFGVLLFAILLSVVTSGSLFQSVTLWGGLGMYLGLQRGQSMHPENS
jgi:O-antigen ligase